MTLAKHLAAALVAGLVLLLLSYKLGSYRDYQLAEVAAYVVAVGGLTVLIGVSGQLSIGQGAFMAIGGYAAALLLIHLAWPLELVIAASAVITAAAGAIVGVAAARLRGPYLAGATLMLAVALPSIADRYQGVFGGDQGLDVTVNVPGFLGPTFQLTQWLAWVCCAAALITLVLLANLVRSGIGRGWRAVRDDEVAAALAGLNVARLRVLAFVVSAACAGVGGGAAGRRDRERLARRVHAVAVHRAAHRGGAGRAGQPGRRGLGQPAAGPGAQLPDRLRGQPRPVRRGQLQRADRRLRLRAHRRHARLPRRDPGRPAPPVRLRRAGRRRAARLVQLPAPARAGA